MLMVGMEGSAVLAVRKVVVVARVAGGRWRRGRRRVVHVRRVWMVEVRAVEVRIMAVRIMAVSSTGTLQPPREAHQEGSGLVWASFPIVNIIDDGQSRCS